MVEAEVGVVVVFGVTSVVVVVVVVVVAVVVVDVDVVGHGNCASSCRSRSGGSLDGGLPSSMWFSVGVVVVVVYTKSYGSWM